jgi:hypothetical protein
MLVGVFEGFNEEARAAIYAAQAGSRRLGASAAGSEHLLLGVMAVDSVASRTLGSLGVGGASEVERAVARRAGTSIAEDASVRWTRTCLPIFETCLRNRIDHGGGPIGVEYLAMALTYERYGDAAGILADLSGLELADMRAGLMQGLGIGSWNEPSTSLVGGPHLAEGCTTPEEVALRGFRPEDGAYVVGARYEEPDHAVVQVGFPGKAAFYWLNIYRQKDGWRLERRL